MDTILLYSGGLDSFVSAGLLLEQDPQRQLVCLFFDFDQHTVDVEWEATRACLNHFPKDRIVLLRRHLADYKPYVEDVSVVGGGRIPTKDEASHLYFVPGRNILFLLYAAILGYPHGCRELCFSPHAWVHAGDCLPEFIKAQQEAFQWGFGMEKKKEPYRIWSPIAMLGKDDVVREGTRLGLPLHISWSCHDAKKVDNRYVHCGVCHNCDERIRAYQLAGIPDATEYLPALYKADG